MLSRLIQVQPTLSISKSKVSYFHFETTGVFGKKKKQKILKRKKIYRNLNHFFVRVTLSLLLIEHFEISEYERESSVLVMTWLIDFIPTARKPIR